MASLPVSVVCFHCLTRFDVNVAIGEGVETTFRQSKALCRTCGRWALIPDGVYTFERLAREAAARASARQRRELYKVLSKATGSTDPDALLRRIASLDGPWSELVSFMRSIAGSRLAQSPAMGNLLGFIALLMEILKH